jgi:hypothetical protein
MYILTRRVKSLSGGLSRREGQSVGSGEVPKSVFDAWIRDGILVESMPSHAQPKEVVQTEPGDAVKDGPPAFTMPEADLRELAKELGIKHYWLKGHSNLADEVDEHLAARGT